jgi:hypothetical protein
MQLKIIKPSFWWSTRFLIYAADQTLLYACKRELHGLALRWHARDMQGRDLFYFNARNTFQLADGRRRSISPRNSIVGHLWGDILISGDQCEDLLVKFQDRQLHWKITTPQQQVVAAARRMLYGWRSGCEIDIYCPEFLEEIIAFAIFYNLRQQD